MRRVTKLLFASLTFTFLYAGSTSIAHADPVVITFTNPTQTVVGGSTGSFSASLTNTSSSPVTISGSLLTINIVGEFEGTLISLFFENSYSNLVNPATGGPLVLAPGESTGVIPIFRFQTSGFFAGPNSAIASGLFIVSEGDVFIPANERGRAIWSVTILPNPNPIPEPATALLLGTSLVGLAAKVYRKRRRQNSQK
jgi:hypothetical protein